MSEAYTPPSHIFCHAEYMKSFSSDIPDGTHSQMRPTPQGSDAGSWLSSPGSHFGETAANWEASHLHDMYEEALNSSIEKVGSASASQISKDS